MYDNNQSIKVSTGICNQKEKPKHLKQIQILHITQTCQLDNLVGGYRALLHVHICESGEIILAFRKCQTGIKELNS